MSDNPDRAREFAKSLPDAALVTAAFTASDRPRRYSSEVRRAILREMAFRLRIYSREPSA